MKPSIIPESWKSAPYGDHWSFSYTTERGEREDYDFRVEFNETIGIVEESAIMRLLEAAPKLLAVVVGLMDAGYLDDTGGLHDQAREVHDFVKGPAA